MKINGFNELKELQESFPIGTVAQWIEPISYIGFYNNERDLQILRSSNKVESIEIIDNCRVNIIPKKQPDIVINGYIFDEEKWWPAYDTWDGWVEWSGDD